MVAFYRRKVMLVGAIAVVAAAIAAVAVLLPSEGVEGAAEVTMYKTPYCDCCSKWSDHLRAKGHTVITKKKEDLDAIKKSLGVPETLESCHTAVVDGYVIEGHVPAEDIARLLAERPDATGLAVAGMVTGSPGMEGDVAEPYNVILFKRDGSASVYARH
jgi:hypothetical protein